MSDLGGCIVCFKQIYCEIYTIGSDEGILLIRVLGYYNVCIMHLDLYVKLGWGFSMELSIFKPNCEIKYKK